MAYPDRHGTNRATFVRARRWRRAARTGRPQRTAGGALPLLGGLGRRFGAAAQRGLGRAARKWQDGVAELVQGCLRRRPVGRGAAADAPRHPRSPSSDGRTAAAAGVVQAAAAQGRHCFGWLRRMDAGCEPMAQSCRRVRRALPAKTSGGLARRSPHAGSGWKTRRTCGCSARKSRAAIARCACRRSQTTAKSAPSWRSNWPRNATVRRVVCRPVLDVLIGEVGDERLHGHVRPNLR